jgi:predicted nuclease with TOPRIM domain
VNLKELKEIYYLIKESKYKETTLNSLYRHLESIQFQTFVLAYTFIKYKKKVKNISYRFIKLNDSIKENYNYSLFCINREKNELINPKISLFFIIKNIMDLFRKNKN